MFKASEVKTVLRDKNHESHKKELLLSKDTKLGKTNIWHD